MPSPKEKVFNIYDFNAHSALGINPFCLYKFRDWNNYIHREILIKNQLYCAPPITLNDPFDCHIEFLFNEISEDDIRNLYKSSNKNCSEDEFVERFTHNFKNNKTELINNINEKYTYNKNNETGVCSLTSTISNVIFWSHYSNSHEGWALGFNFEKLIGFLEHYIQFLNQQKIESNLLFLRVNYLNNYPKLKYFNITDMDKLLATHAIKSKDWYYEHEFRVIILNFKRTLTKIDRLIHFPDSIIEKVVLGCKMSVEHEEEIKEVLRNKPIKIPIYKATKKSFEFGLDFIEVDY